MRAQNQQTHPWETVRAIQHLIPLPTKSGHGRSTESLSTYLPTPHFALYPQHSSRGIDAFIPFSAVFCASSVNDAGTTLMARSPKSSTKLSVHKHESMYILTRADNLKPPLL
jgi:hypothetical protein